MAAEPLLLVAGAAFCRVPVRALEQGGENRVDDDLNGKKHPQHDARQLPGAAGMGAQQVGGLRLLLVARNVGDEVDKVAGREQQAEDGDGGRAGTRDSLGDDAEGEPDEGGDDAGELGLFEEAGAEQRHGRHGDAGEDEEGNDDGVADVCPDEDAVHDGGDDPAGQVGDDEGVVVGEEPGQLAVPLGPDGHHGVNQLRHANLALGGDEARHVVADADKRHDEGDAEKVDKGPLRVVPVAVGALIRGGVNDDGAKAPARRPDRALADVANVGLATEASRVSAGRRDGLGDGVEDPVNGAALRVVPRVDEDDGVAAAGRVGEGVGERGYGLRAADAVLVVGVCEFLAEAEVQRGNDGEDERRVQGRDKVALDDDFERLVAQRGYLAVEIHDGGGGV
ncbi:hypothetical protein BM221_001034 [Beauveria bassiana]|uniref:Uncharacterized protein n=1 Tax=Beauveria bassiana TaxID=176275 RepID=A0A2N6P257_BEABA|nr:hypothetical protein BM221_001034 [Beauveria bassiana]